MRAHQSVYVADRIGTGILEDRERVDFKRIRSARRERLFALMDRIDVDACIFGREANARYASGARRLWTAGSRPFGPTCVAVRSTRRIHLMTFSGSYEGTPSEVDFDDVFCNSFNISMLMERMRNVEGLVDAKSIGVDGFSMLMRQVLPAVAPNAEFVGIEPDLRAMRRVKLPDEITALRTAIAIGEAGVSQAIARLDQDATEKDLQAAFLDRICTLGTSQFAQQGTFTVIGPRGGLRWITGHHPIPDGSMVAVAAGALWAGYEGSVARTWWHGQKHRPTAAHRDLYRRWRAATRAVIAACRPGAQGADLCAAHAESGEALPAFPIVYSVGLGHEGPITGICSDRGHDPNHTLSAGMVLAVRTFIPSPLGGFLGEDVIAVHEDRTEVLTALGHGALEEK